VKDIAGPERVEVIVVVDDREAWMLDDVLRGFQGGARLEVAERKSDLSSRGDHGDEFVLLRL
jgi:hypothetical protein